MDLEEWEVLPRDASFFDFHGGDGGKKMKLQLPLSPPRSAKGSSPYSPPNPVNSDDFDMNYFSVSRVVVPRSHLIPFELEPEPELEPKPEPESESASQVFFKKMKEAEFADMKMDSPKSQTSPSPVWESPRLDSSGKFSFDDDGELSSCSSPRMVKDDDDDDSGGLNLWKWSLHGIGAICSFGFAAATVCIIIFGRNKQLQNQQLRFQIYTDDKRVKQVVQHATRFNDAISAVRGVPIARAQVTFGGYYDAI
ncbi:hypothetical protein LINGRAPRIM_LOCUS3078 [Linum grandiflorum]